VVVVGDRMVISDDEEQVGGVSHAGALYVYDRSGTTWSAPARLVAPDPKDSDNLGSSLALEADTLVAGAVWNLHGGAPGPFRFGQLFIFTREGTTWASQTIAGTDRTTGWSVAIDGNRIAYSTPGETGGSPQYWGAVDILEKANSTWQPVESLKSPDSALQHYFGNSLGLVDEALLVGAPVFSNSSMRLPGAVYGYTTSSLRKAAGQPCSQSSECGGDGICVDGVCCATACGGGDTHDCQACSVAAGGTQDGVCTPLAANRATTVICRPAAGACDVAETCQPTATMCPPDLHANDGVSCDDGLVCNGVATCSGGTCNAGTAPACLDDDDPCTVAECAEPAGCHQRHLPNCPVPLDAGVDAGSDAGGTVDMGSDAGGTVDASMVYVDAGPANDAGAPDSGTPADVGTADVNQGPSGDARREDGSAGPADSGFADAGPGDPGQADGARSDAGGLDQVTSDGNIPVGPAGMNAGADGGDHGQASALDAATDRGPSLASGCTCSVDQGSRPPGLLTAVLVAIGLVAGRRRSTRSRRNPTPLSISVP
jgi:MYXO-CTERM domain-containing protein